jgi:Kef-type K+ transport system membrane component KefB
MVSLFADEQPKEVVRSLAHLDAEALLLPILIQLIVIIAAARGFGALARKLGQPSVVGEIVAGLLLGPSLLGWFCPQLFAAIFQPSLGDVPQPVADATIAKVFTIIAQIGLILLLFLVGLEFEGSHVRSHGRAAVLISLAGIAVPFALGASLAPFIHSHLELHPTGGEIPLLGLTLFLGVALSITAIPVLGRIMMELNITRTRLGAITITAAAVDDACGWILLATVAAIVKANFNPALTFRMVGLTVMFVLFLVFIARPLLVRYFATSLRASRGKLSVNALAVLFVSLFLCAVATNLIGIFAVFGAFLLGAVLSAQAELREVAAEKLHDVVTGFFVPVFFAYTGLRTDVTSLNTGAAWVIFAVVVLAAVTGKLLGCGVAARVSGFRWREAFIIGAMMNSRGLMALIAINLGYELGVVPRSLFSVLVLMALATTMLTTPMLLWLRRGTEIEEPIARSGFLVRSRSEEGDRGQETVISKQ